MHSVQSKMKKKMKPNQTKISWNLKSQAKYILVDHAYQIISSSMLYPVLPASHYTRNNPSVHYPNENLINFPEVWESIERPL